MPAIVHVQSLHVAIRRVRMPTVTKVVRRVQRAVGHRRRARIIISPSAVARPRVRRPGCYSHTLSTWNNLRPEYRARPRTQDTLGICISTSARVSQMACQTQSPAIFKSTTLVCSGIFHLFFFYEERHTR